MTLTAPAPVVHDADVVVAGLGPVGLLAAILLGRRGYTVHAVERWHEQYGRPRAVTFDHEIARLLGLIGINAEDDAGIEHHGDHYYWVNQDYEVLLEPDWISKEANGYHNRYWFNQPELEGRLLVLARTLPNVHVHMGREVTGFTQDADGVTLTYQEIERGVATPVLKEGGEVGEVRARYAIASDGANSYIRRSVNYELTDLGFRFDWLIVDTFPNEYPSYYTAHFQLCDPKRPTTVVPGGPGRRRWEFMLLPGESPAEMATPEKAWELLEPWGITADNAVLERCAVPTFEGKYLENWRAGRALFVGDAAHLMPPFAGEGMCAGFRDVVNLIWRLDLVLQGEASMLLLDEWSDERREQAKWYIQFSVNLGKVICIADPEEAASRDARMKAEYAAQAKVGPIPTHEAVLGPGTWIPADDLAGKTSIQGRVAYRGYTGRFDEAVGRDAWFLLSLKGTEDEVSPDRVARLTGFGGHHLTVGPQGSGADVIDIEAVYTNWFAAHDVTHLLVRPDFYVAFTAKGHDQFSERFDTLVRSLAPIAVAA